MLRNSTNDGFVRATPSGIPPTREQTNHPSSRNSPTEQKNLETDDHEHKHALERGSYEQVHDVPVVPALRRHRYPIQTPPLTRLTATQEYATTANRYSHWSADMMYNTTSYHHRSGNSDAVEDTRYRHNVEIPPMYDQDVPDNSGESEIHNNERSQSVQPAPVDHRSASYTVFRLRPAYGVVIQRNRDPGDRQNTGTVARRRADAQLHNTPSTGYTNWTMPDRTRVHTFNDTQLALAMEISYTNRPTENIAGSQFHAGTLPNATQAALMTSLEQELACGVSTTTDSSHTMATQQPTDATLPSNEALKQDGERDERAVCCVCKVDTPSVVIVPCLHLCLCVPCADSLVHHKCKSCPICRVQIGRFLKTY